MTSRHDKPKWWRPKFSARTLVIVVTLVCIYVACWGPTMRQGVDDVSLHIATELVERSGSSEDSREVAQRAKDAAKFTATVPFIVSVDKLIGWAAFERHYYFWFFGYVAKLPFEREL